MLIHPLEDIYDAANAKVTWIVGGGCHHFGFCKPIAISLLYDQSSPNLVQMLQLSFGINQWRQKYKNDPTFKMAAAAIVVGKQLTTQPTFTKFSVNV